MIKIIQGEFYRVRKSRLFFVCLLLSTFFMFALALSFHYNTIKVPARIGANTIVSLNKFTEFLFSDYSLILPLTLFLDCYFTEDYHKGTHEILFSKGISRTDFLFGKLIVSWITTLLYLIFNFLMAYLFIFSMWTKQQYIDYSLTRISGYLALQILCFMGYSAFLWLLSCLFRFRNLLLIINVTLLGTLYLYLTKISTALDLTYSLYQYWIVGLSQKMAIDLYLHQLPIILFTITIYILLPTIFSLFVYGKADLRRRERR